MRRNLHRRIVRSRKLLWQRAWLFIAAFLVVLALSSRSAAFKIGVQLFGWPSIHEEITADAIGFVMPQRNPLMVNNVQSGVYNTDLSHQPVNAFHFDNSTISNGGFENGFATLHGMLGLSAAEAQTCTPGPPVSTPPSQPSSSQVQVVLPISKSQEDPIHGVGYMHTDINISKNSDGSGQLSATTHTWSAKDLEGFHGSVAAAILDQNQRLLWVSQTQSYGVDGKHVPFGGPSDRTDKWNDTLPAQVLPQARYLAIEQKWNPKPVTLDDIGNWLRGLGDNAANELRSALQAVETLVTETGGNSTHGANAIGNCSINPLFLNPQHASYRDLVEDISGTYFNLSVNEGCLAELACPTDDFAAGGAFVGVDVLPTLLDTDPDPDEVAAYTFQGTSLSIPVPNFAGMVGDVKSKLDSILGPHCRPEWTAWPPGSNPVCFDRLEDMAPSDNDFQLLAGHLRILQYEYQAYYAWQHLGHALHTTQDFFAHSNYVELAAGHKGPPCTPGSYEAATICDSPLNNSAPSGQMMTTVPFGAIPLPTDSNFPWSLGQFQNSFNIVPVAKVLDANPARRLFSDGNNSSHLQTGYFPCIPGAGSAPHDDGFAYCHTATQSIVSNGSAGMNKDELFAAGGELNHQNHQWARQSATRMSVALFGAFLASLPNSANLISGNMAATAANPVGAILWPAQPPLQVGGIAFTNPGIRNIDYPLSTAQQLRLKTQKPVAAPPRIAPFGVIQRSLPPITKPELLQPVQKPHIYVKLFPNRAFHPGEHVALTVEAFDARTGAPLRGLPTVIGDARGVTGKPIPLTIALTTTKRCSSVAGQSFCLNVLTPPSGSVGPAGSYPSAGFTLSAVMPRLLVSVVGGKSIQPGAPFTVSAVDARTHQPVVGAQVLQVEMRAANRIPAQQAVTSETQIAVANRPASYVLKEVAPLQPKRRIGLETRIETLPASFGPPLIVRAPGYSDEFVHYVISKEVPSVRRPGGTVVRP